MSQSFDFDRITERRGTGALKYDSHVQRGKDPSLLPLWVADMDFPAPPCVLEALEKRVAHGIFGYSEPDDTYYEALNNWFDSRYGLPIKRKQVTTTPGVVFALAQAVQAFTQPGEAVLIQPPVYYPFTEVVKDNSRTLVRAPLTLDEQTLAYSLDFDAFEAAVVQNNVKLFILCNPHNPVGRVWTADELRRLGDICLAHNVTVVSDEIHADFARKGFTHVPFASLGREYADICITCTAPSKTFNLAGLQVSNIIISNPELRAQFRASCNRAGYSQAGVMGTVACQACYQEGAPWLEALKDYLEGNYQALRVALAAEAPALRVTPLQSTYLAWVDCRALGLSDAELERLVEDEAGLWVDMGTMFGPEGSGFIRINMACPRQVLMQAAHQLAAAATAALQ